MRSMPTPTTKRHAQDVYLGSAPTAIANNSFYEQSSGAMKNAMISHQMCTVHRGVDCATVGIYAALAALELFELLTLLSI